MNRYEFYDNVKQFKEKDLELKHYGTIGQKWGVRKWQNYDGTFNEAGKERYFGKSNKEKIGSILSLSRKVKTNLNKGMIANGHRKSLVKDAIKNREAYDAVNLTDDEIRSIAEKVEFPEGNGGDWVHDAQQQFKRESLKLQESII